MTQGGYRPGGYWHFQWALSVSLDNAFGNAITIKIISCVIDLTEKRCNK